MVSAIINIVVNKSRTYLKDFVCQCSIHPEYWLVSPKPESINILQKSWPI